MATVLTLFTGMSNLGYRYGATEGVVVTSAHEAAHCIVGQALGLHITGVEVYRREQDGYLGRAYYENEDAIPDTLFSTFLAAGHAGEQYVDAAIRANAPDTAKYRHTVYGSDLDGIQTRGWDHRIDDLVRHAHTFLKMHRRAFENVTYALMEHGRLSEGDLRYLVGDRLADYWRTVEAPSASSSRTSMTSGGRRPYETRVRGLRYGSPMPITEVR